jgi:DNA (cytosine-5)-methyltransferase 1
MRVGSLFTGYGGLDMAVVGDLAWYAEIEPAACEVLAHHHPDVPNLGDITEVDWSQVEPVDIITGGYPCQPFSHAGSRRGKNDERHLWPCVRDAIHALRPNYAILENVSGHLTLGLADVLADLAEIGWSCEWGTYRASDVGAPHRRERIFIVAYADRAGRGERGGAFTVQPEFTTAKCLGDVVTNTSSERHGGGEGSRGLERVGSEAKGSGWKASAPRQEFGAGSVDFWGKYAPAITRWELTIGRLAPAPTIERNDRPRLNPCFVEWMMGLPDGWVTGHGLSAAKELKMLGNGVVPQQAAAAISQLMERTA